MGVWMLSGANPPEYQDQAGLMRSYSRGVKMQKCTPVNFKHGFNDLRIQQLDKDFDILCFGFKIQFEHHISMLRTHISFWS